MELPKNFVEVVVVSKQTSEKFGLGGFRVNDATSNSSPGPLLENSKSHLGTLLSNSYRLRAPLLLK